MQVASNSSQNVELMLQESCTDQSGSLVVYTTIDVDSIQLAMSGEDPSCIALLPQGFIIVPMVSSNNNADTSIDGNSSEPQQAASATATASSGCLLTVGLQVLASTIPSAKLNLSSVTAITNHLCTTLHQIEAALCSTTNNVCHNNDHNNGSFAGSCTEPTSTSAPPKQWTNFHVTKIMLPSLPLLILFWNIYGLIVVLSVDWWVPKKNNCGTLGHAL